MVQLSPAESRDASWELSIPQSTTGPLERMVLRKECFSSLNTSQVKLVGNLRRTQLGLWS